MLVVTTERRECFWCVGDKDVANHRAMHFELIATPTTENHLVPNVNSAEVEKPCTGAGYQEYDLTPSP